MFKAVYALGNTNNAVFFPDVVVEANETANPAVVLAFWQNTHVPRNASHIR